MRIRTALTAVAAAAVAATPLAAAQARVSMPVEGESEMGGVSALAGVAIFAAIVAAVYFVADSEDEPVSP
ncbi:MAG: hypothetical protein KJ703_08260 [Alphaproteobacteria bacterium]|nr:hypothetical protein [Alphaproteobacteria bacterium]